MKKFSCKESFQRGFIYYVLSTCLLAVLFFFYLIVSSQSGYMDLGGWVFYVASCLSQAAQVTLPFLLLYLLFAGIGFQRTATTLFVLGVVLLSTAAYLDQQVYALYRFHINGFILNMVFGAGAGDIFSFAPMLMVKQTVLFLLLAAVCIAAWYAGAWFWKKRRKAYVKPVVLTLFGMTLFAQLFNAYSAFVRKASVIKSSMVIPYYYPLEANRLFLRLGFPPPTELPVLNSTLQTPARCVIPAIRFGSRNPIRCPISF